MLLERNNFLEFYIGNMTNKSKKSELRKTIVISTQEGILAQIFSTIASLGSVFITKFLVMIGATAFQFSIVAAIGQLSQIFQPIGVIVTQHKTNRKSTVIVLNYLGRGIAFLFGFIPFLFPKEASIWVFIGLLFFSSSLQAVAGNAWIAWISDAIPLRYRASFFSRRTQYLMIAGLSTGYVLGFLIDMFDAQPKTLAYRFLGLFDNPEFFNLSNLPYVFFSVFAIAAIIGLIGLKILKRQPEHSKPIENDSYIQTFTAPLKDKNFRRLLIYGFWWMLVVGIGSPFWQPFMIKNLQMSVLNIQIYGTISTIASLIALRPWGRLIDRVGNKTAMRIAIVLGGINPLVWIFLTADSYWIVYIEAFTSGIMWAGANIIGTNFVLSIAPPQKRQIYSGIFGAFSGFAIMITMLISGAFLPKAMDIFGLHLEPEQVLFGLTGILRWTAEIPLSWVHEPNTKPLGYVMYRIRQYTNVKLGNLAVLIFKRNNK